MLYFWEMPKLGISAKKKGDKNGISTSCCIYCILDPIKQNTIKILQIQDPRCSGANSHVGFLGTVTT